MNYVEIIFPLFNIVQTRFLIIFAFNTPCLFYKGRTRNTIMPYTPYQTKYFAWELTKSHSTSDDDKFTSVLTEAQVDLNPHQIDAALFAFRSPLSMGAILADEVGLGKTIEAALVIAQKWAEHRRHILVIAPATLRKQWSVELEEKFFLPSIILEAKSFNSILCETYSNPFDTESNVVICSYQFAKKQIRHIERVSWDLVVIDEAHKLRNVYKANNKTAIVLREGLKGFKKLLLTATPLQNNIKELYGLISIIDENYFGNLNSYSSLYGKAEKRHDEVFVDLRERIKPIIHRTLRSEVQEYVKYTERKPFVQEYYPSEDEIALQEFVQEYLKRDECFGMPVSQRTLISLVLHKLLSSSTFAVAGTLQTIINRLRKIVDNNNKVNNDDLLSDIAEDVPELEEYEDEWFEEEEDESDNNNKREEKEYTPEDIENIKGEIHDLEVIHSLALGIASNTKGECLLKTLDIAFKDKREHGQAEKALIFTESNRTQLYLKELLETNGYAGKIVLFNGSNSDPISKQIYQNWKIANTGTSRITGSITADRRQAIVDFFRDSAQIMIATEAASEGINLQFCSLLVNYDLPWNPLRIEQRIGRCHRYGQKNDVVVVNFINKANRADQRVYELLDEKYNLFKGVFGSSDEVLGKAMDGLDFEHRVLDIYQSCRNVEEIDAAFDRLQAEMQVQINETISDTHSRLIENFDQDVVNKLRIRMQTDELRLTQFQQLLWTLTVNILSGHINKIDSEKYQFSLKKSPSDATCSFETGSYQMGKSVEEAYTYRIGHPLAEYVLTKAKSADTSAYVNILFDYTSSVHKVSILEERVGQNGSLSVSLLKFKCVHETEEHIVGVALDTDGNLLPSDFVSKLMMLPATVEETATDACNYSSLEHHVENAIKNLGIEINERNKKFINEESEKIGRWADDQTFALEHELRDIKRRIKEKERTFSTETDSVTRLEQQKEIQSLQRLMKQKRQALFILEDEIDERRNMLIKQIEESLNQNISEEKLFIINWTIK